MKKNPIVFGTEKLQGSDGGGISEGKFTERSGVRSY